MGIALLCLALVPWTEDGQNFLQALSNLPKIPGRARHEGQSDLLFVRLAFIAKMLPRSRDGVTLFIQQLLDAHHVLHVPPAVHALPCAAFYRLQLWKFGLPKTQDVCGKTAKACDFPDPKIQLLWNQDIACLGGLVIALLFRTHSG